MELSKNQHKLTEMKTSERIQKTKKHNEVLLLYQCTCSCIHVCTHALCTLSVLLKCTTCVCTVHVHNYTCVHASMCVDVACGSCTG